MRLKIRNIKQAAAIGAVCAAVGIGGGICAWNGTHAAAGPHKGAVVTGADSAVSSMPDMTSSADSLISTPAPTAAPLPTATPTPVPPTATPTPVLPTATPEPTATPVPAEDAYPMTYSDGTANITVVREWYGQAWCYAAHVVLSDYSRFSSSCANGSYGAGKESTSSAAARLGAVLCVNGDYSSPDLGYAVARGGTVWNDKADYSPALYNANTGRLFWGDDGSPTGGTQLSSLVSSGQVTDTFCFGPARLRDGQIRSTGEGSRAQRTFMGTNGNPGDLWIVVSDGRMNDGESSGLTMDECMAYLQSKGCTFGIPLDGGGSSTMVFQGKVLNAAAGQERAVVDFAYVR